MKKLKILHAADFHLDSLMLSVGALADLRRQEQLQTFGKAIDLAKEEQVDLVALSGDLFDSGYAAPETQSYIVKKIREIPDIPVFLALGNHDYSFRAPMPENVHIFGDSIEKISWEGADIYGIAMAGGYGTTCNIEGFTVDDPSKINIFVLHGDTQPGVYNPITPAIMAASGADYFALGHVHMYSGLQKAGGSFYAYPGIPEGRGFDELGEKGVLLAEVGKNHVDARFVRLCKRKHMELTVDITDCSDYDDILRLIETEPNDLYKIILKGEAAFTVIPSLLADLLADRCFYVKIYDRTKPKIDREALAGEYSLKGLFVKNAAANDMALKYGLAALDGEKVPLP
jgi:DNA repair exonuclease SbcCD nuclease subunit